MMRKSRLRSRRTATLPAALLSLAALTGAGLAAAVPATLAVAPAAQAATAAPGEALPPLNCPSAACRKLVQGIGGPNNVTLDGQGNAYVTDYSNGKLWRVDAESGEHRMVTDGLGSPEGVAVDGDTVYVVDRGGTFWAVDAETGTKHEVATNVDAKLCGLALDGEGNAYIGSKDSGTLWKVDLKTGRPTEAATGLGGADGVAIDPSTGTAYVTDTANYKLWSVNLNNGSKTEVATDLDGDPDNVALNAAGDAAYITDHDHGKLIRVDLGSGRKTDVVTGLGEADGVTLDESGTAYVADYSGKLWKVTGVDEGGESPGGLDARVRPGKPASGKPGDHWVYPSVVVTNTGEKRIGKQPVTVRAPKNMRFEENRITLSRNDKEETHSCKRSTDRRTLTCTGVALDLDSGQSVVAYPQMGVDRDAHPGTEADVTFDIGSPAFASGDTGVDIR